MSKQTTFCQQNINNVFRVVNCFWTECEICARKDQTFMMQVRNASLTSPDAVPMATFHHYVCDKCFAFVIPEIRMLRWSNAMEAAGLSYDYPVPIVKIPYDTYVLYEGEDSEEFEFEWNDDMDSLIKTLQENYLESN